MSMIVAVFLLAAVHASSAWDSSNIWFPDRNNPVFYNMTFYQEAAKAVQSRPAMAATARPTFHQEPVMVVQRQPATAATARPTEPERARPTWTRVSSSVVPSRQQGVKTSRIPVQDNRNTGSFQDDRIEYNKPTPVQDNTSQLREMFNRNRKVNRQPSSNRLQRREYQEVGYRSVEEPREYNMDRFQDRDVRQSNNEVGSGRQDSRGWGNTAPAGNEASNTVESDIIETTSKSSGPSKCVWAIISCCKPTSPEIRYMCFETLGCHGAFWDSNPCSKQMTLAAVQATANFYNVPTTDD